jgi:hypothetical protein
MSLCPTFLLTETPVIELGPTWIQYDLVFVFPQCWGSNPGPSYTRQVLYHWVTPHPLTSSQFDKIYTDPITQIRSHPQVRWIRTSMYFGGDPIQPIISTLSRNNPSQRKILPQTGHFITPIIYLRLAYGPHQLLEFPSWPHTVNGCNEPWSTAEEHPQVRG